ncbi:MAG: F0F1 ATP synthase subunit A [Deltaproteobacteria bacterium]|nr:F0F1 ATP synthase subunit A [Deltaproteobacteria bacterium]
MEGHGVLWGPMWMAPVAQIMAQYGIDPVTGTHSLIVAALLVVFAWLAGRPFRKAAMVEPDGRASLTFMTESALGAMHSFFEGVVQHHLGRLFMVLATFSLFILVSNLLGLIPGFLPPTDQFNLTFTLAIIVYLTSHFIGIREHGFGYIKKFLGPIWWITPLLFPIELMSNLMRPVSLSVRLFGNMFGDHKVITIFASFLALGLPIPFLGLGLMVAGIQAFVFVLLAAVYFQDALDHPH